MLVLETPTDLSFSESIGTLYDAEPFFTLAAIAWTQNKGQEFFLLLYYIF